ncbi:hypothetical protein [Streptomyces sp. NPDC002403]
MSVRTGSLLAVTMAGLALAVAAPTAAHADDKLIIKHCNTSNAREYLEFPNRGGWASTIINPGQCWQSQIGGLSDDIVVGHRYSNGLWPQVSVKYFSDYGADFEFKF